MVGRPLAQNPERGVREEKKARYFNMEHGWHTHCLLFLGHVNVKSGFLDCSCLIDLVWKGLPRCQVKLSWIGCWQLSASSSIYDFPRSLRWTGAMLISWFFVLRCYVRFHRRILLYYTYIYTSSTNHWLAVWICLPILPVVMIPIDLGSFWDGCLNPKQVLDKAQSHHQSFFSNINHWEKYGKNHLSRFF